MRVKLHEGSRIAVNVEFLVRREVSISVRIFIEIIGHKDGADVGQSLRDVVELENLLLGTWTSSVDRQIGEKKGTSDLS